MSYIMTRTQEVQTLLYLAAPPQEKQSKKSLKHQVRTSPFSRCCSAKLKAAAAPAAVPLACLERKKFTRQVENGAKTGGGFGFV